MENVLRVSKLLAACRDVARSKCVVVRNFFRAHACSILYTPTRNYCLCSPQHSRDVGSPPPHSQNVRHTAVDLWEYIYNSSSTSMILISKGYVSYLSTVLLLHRAIYSSTQNSNHQRPAFTVQKPPAFWRRNIFTLSKAVFAASS